MSHQDVTASPAQLRYANLLYYGALTGFIIMLVTYTLNMLNIFEPQIPLETLFSVWDQNAATYRAAGNIPQGWGWLGLLNKGDMLNFVGLAILAGLTIVCFFRLCYDFFRNKEYMMATLAFLEILVLCLAASGMFGTGGH